ncbi:MAG TPA: hypothetical protein VN238_15875 [Solirubrobacteraceae bacterium]|nr:hypothetical protein [Solirubrobacteraceae bacterium]
MGVAAVLVGGFRVWHRIVASAFSAAFSVSQDTGRAFAKVWCAAAVLVAVAVAVLLFVVPVR